MARRVRETENPARNKVETHMSWNFRIVKRTYPKTKVTPKQTVLQIHEAYYKKEKDTKPYTITTNAILGPFDNLDDIEFELKAMLKAVKDVRKKKSSILKYKDF